MGEPFGGGVANPKLGSYGLTRDDFGPVIEKAKDANSMKSNPIALTSVEMTEFWKPRFDAATFKRRIIQRWGRLQSPLQKARKTRAAFMILAGIFSSGIWRAISMINSTSLVICPVSWAMAPASTKPRNCCFST